MIVFSPLRAVSALVLTLGCADVAPDDSVHLAEAEQAVVNGIPTASRPEVVRLLGLPVPNSNAQGQCSAVMITGQAFLTAAHCIGFRTWQAKGGVAVAYSPTIPCTSPPTNCPCDGLGNATCREVATIERIMPQGMAPGFSDLAVGRLTKVLTYVPYPAQISLYQPSNTNLTFVGFGCNDRNDTQLTSVGRKRYVSYYYHGQNTYNYCNGDSGGPTFLGLLNDSGAIVRIDSAYSGDSEHYDMGADPVYYRNQLRALAIAMEMSGISYRAHVQGLGFQSATYNGGVAGTVGLSKRLEALQVWSATPGVVPCYRAHVQGQGWQPEVCDGALTGTVGQNLRAEAFQIRLSAKGPYSHVQYRAHVQNLGWQPWIQDGQTCNSNAACPTNLCFNGTCAAGTTGQSLRLEAVQIQVY